MSRRPELLAQRNERIRARFRALCASRPKWRTEAIIDQVAGEFYLSQIMIVKILKSTGEKKVPGVATIYRHQAAAAVA